MMEDRQIPARSLSLLIKPAKWPWPLRPGSSWSIVDIDQPVGAFPALGRLHSDHLSSKSLCLRWCIQFSDAFITVPGWDFPSIAPLG
jgi:hypothetical protein